MNEVDSYRVSTPEGSTGLPKVNSPCKAVDFKGQLRSNERFENGREWTRLIPKPSAPTLLARKWLIVLKLTCCVCGTNSWTVQWDRARAQRIGFCLSQSISLVSVSLCLSLFRAHLAQVYLARVDSHRSRNLNLQPSNRFFGASFTRRSEKRSWGRGSACLRLHSKP